ncbi:MAG: hypothetical protein HDR71_13305 [Lachnospiraceae bacterium]|nr:hypothetical protein [Lachnospiraceae bacterium]
MSTFSTYKELEKPLSTEKYNVAVFNKNTDVIDSELHKLDLKNQSQDNLLATKEELNSEIIRAIATEKVIRDNLSDHNTSAISHKDIRDLISEITSRLNALADSDDTTLDQLSEIVAYIKNNKDLIDNITTSKVNVSAIVDDLTSTAVDKPLSANQGRLLKGLIDNISFEFETEPIDFLTEYDTNLEMNEEQ